MPVTLKVYDNGDHTCLVWLPDNAGPIAGCRGFAIRRIKNGKEDFLPNRVGFNEGEQGPKPSNIWPVQRFLWWDYDVEPSDVVQYSVIPMLGTAAQLKQDNPSASALTPAMTITGQCTASLSAYFNKGIIASQWVAKALAQEGKGLSSRKALMGAIAKVNDPLRDALGGLLKAQVIQLLKQAKVDGGSIYAALYELNDPEVLQCLADLGSSANLVLGNGAFKPPQNDENAQVRAWLKSKTKVNVFDRIVSAGHFAHNKFIVFCDPSGNPLRVLTGSTNTTMTGLCTQANNGLVINDADVAVAFLQQWQRIHEAGNGFPPSLIDADSQPKAFQVDGGQVNVWFVPTSAAQDLQQARTLINQAKHGILFLFFNPGIFEPDPGKWTLLQSILNRHNPTANPYFNSDLYIHGVVNQEIAGLTEPISASQGGATAKRKSGAKSSTTASPASGATSSEMDPAAPVHPVALFASGKVPPQRLSSDALVPAHIGQKYGTWDPELSGASNVMVHSKVVVIDPFGENPVVMTGSHNCGLKASSANDDNLVILQGNGALAAAYALNIIAIYDQYRWRSYVTAHANDAAPWKGLEDDDTWQGGHLQSEGLAEIDFFLGSSVSPPTTNVHSVRTPLRSPAPVNRRPVQTTKATSGARSKKASRHAE